MKPFTYLIVCNPTGQAYYGVRYSKKADPDTLWRTYFTSSKYVRELVSTHGKSAFSFEIRKTFNTAKAAWEWEQKVLRRLKVQQKSYWLNKHVIGAKFRNDGGFSYTYSQKRIDAIKLANTGRKASQETKDKMSKSFTGRKCSDKAKHLIGKSKSQKWVITLPTGVDEYITNLTAFCRVNNLDGPTLLNTVPKNGNTYGKVSSHKGYKARHVGDPLHTVKPPYIHSPERRAKISAARRKVKVL